MSVNCKLGKNVKIYHPDLVNIYGGDSTVIGDETTVAPFVEIQDEVVIGSCCKLSFGCFVPRGTIIGNKVFLGPNCTLTNDKYPKACNLDGSLKKTEDWRCEPVIIEDGVSVGAGSCILPGVKLSKDCIIGSNSTVTKDVPSGQIWVGNPAKQLKKSKEPLFPF